MVAILFRNWRRILQATISMKTASFYESLVCLVSVFILKDDVYFIASTADTKRRKTQYKTEKSW